MKTNLLIKQSKNKEDLVLTMEFDFLEVSTLPLEHLWAAFDRSSQELRSKLLKYVNRELKGNV